MNITRMEAYNTAREIVDYLSETVENVQFGRDKDGDDVLECIASILFDKDGKVWNNCHSGWDCHLKGVK